ncbi:MAG: 50S ribosomal protein L11 methyltransferase [Moraxellaceae bacterium]|nr:50S ribosomal protein L11 methyltransferase [Pseudobdellovibrionaceae bacterium]
MTTTPESSANPTYFKVRLSHVPRVQEADVTDLCFDHQALGLSEVLGFTQPDLTYEPSLRPRSMLELEVFFEKTPEQSFFDDMKNFNSMIQVRTSEEESKDWLEEWKKGFVPFKLVGPVWVVPSWIEKPSDVEIEIKIDPGMAFGTGTHATTKMASYFIYKLATENKDSVGDWAVLDVGTGTAILAVLAEHCGYGFVTGVEIDAEARRKARENCELNKTKTIEITDKPLDEIKDQYDVVVANIIDGILIRLKKDLLKVLKPGGHLFLTGILQERDNHFFDHFIEASPEIKVVRRIQKDEWVGYWVQKVH